MKRFLFIALLVFPCISLSAQTDRHEVRSGNRKFSKEKFRESEVEYRKSLLKDSTSLAGNYNLASALYKEGNYEEAGKLLEGVSESAAAAGKGADCNYNAGDIALQKKDYAAAVKAFRESLLQNPGDLDAKENYIYAKKMLENQQNQQNQNQDQNQDQDQQNQQDQDQQDQNQDRQQQQPQDQKISPRQAQQMLKAVQAQEQKTQDKVKKEKAAVLQSRQKEKNW